MHPPLRPRRCWQLELRQAVPLRRPAYEPAYNSPLLSAQQRGAAALQVRRARARACCRPGAPLTSPCCASSTAARSSGAGSLTALLSTARPAQAEGLADLPGLLARYADRNLTAAFAPSHSLWTAAGSSGGGFTLSVRVRVPSHQLVLYRCVRLRLAVQVWAQAAAAAAAAPVAAVAAAGC
jgi:hypothetical protein